MADLFTRFAPTPSGFLHLGHALSALLCDAIGNGFLLRIEDTDTTRSRPHFYKALIEDLEWLGCRFPSPPLIQSTRIPLYHQYLHTLIQKKAVFPCFCSRKDIAQALKVVTPSPLPLYPGTCRHLSPSQRQERIKKNHPHSWRLDSHAFLSQHKPLSFYDISRGTLKAPLQKGHDIILARKVPSKPSNKKKEDNHLLISYHLASVIDDAYQKIPLIVRGEDLLSSTTIHLALHILLDFPTPLYIHHGLIKDEKGRKLSKRDQDTSLREWRINGKTPDHVRKAVHNLYEPCLQDFRLFITP